MDSQIFLPGMEPPGMEEQAFLTSITHQMTSAVETHGGPGSLLIISPTKGYSAVILGTLTVFRLCLRGKRRYISIPTKFEDLIPENWPTKFSKSEDKYIRVTIGENPLDLYADFLSSLAGIAVDRYPKDWDCCSRYTECSDAKRCVHPDKLMALTCGYRKVLNTGKIYYGKNCNV